MKLLITALASLSAAPAFAHQSVQSQHFHLEHAALLAGLLIVVLAGKMAFSRSTSSIRPVVAAAPTMCQHQESVANA